MTPVILHRRGTGPAVVLLHAFPLNAKMWDEQVLVLARNFAVWAPDLPGFGAAGGRAAFASLDELAGALHDELTQNGVARASIVGCSMGGYLAFAMLGAAPGLCIKLVLVNTKAAADSEPARANRIALAQRVEREGCAFLADEWHLGALSKATLESRPQVVARVRSLVREATPAGVAAAQRAMAARPDSSNLLSSIDIPALVVHGLDDKYVSADEARAMAAAIDGARFLGVEQAAHLPNMEQSAIVTAALLDFLN